MLDETRDLILRGDPTRDSVKRSVPCAQTTPDCRVLGTASSGMFRSAIRGGGGGVAIQTRHAFDKRA